MKKLLFLIPIFIALPLTCVQAQQEPDKIDNLLKIDSFSELANNIIGFIRIIAIFIAVIMIIYAGFLFMTSAGEEEKISKAKKALLWALVGLAVFLIGTGWVKIVKDVLNAK